MKISSNYSHTVNFGYNKQLNRELKRNLLIYPDKTFARSIWDLNLFCNKLEKILEIEEKNINKNNSKYFDYRDLFLSCKETLVGCIEMNFHRLGYADREYLDYHNSEADSKNKSWKTDICNILYTWTSFSKDQNAMVQVQKNIKKSSAEQQLVPETDKISKPESEAEKPVKPPTETQFSASKYLLSKESLLEEYKKSSSSPAGFSDVAGMDNLIRDLNEGIIQFIKNPQQAQLDYEEYGKTMPKSILLYGPPGCGKTYITQALASEINVPMYLLNISKAGSRYINMTSKNIKAAFDEAISISEKTQQPCILFMDEIDSLGFDRITRMEHDDLKQVSTMLQAMDEAKKSNLIIIGATNKYNLLDPAIRRRFESKFFVDVPDKESIKDLLRKNLSTFSKGQELLSSEEDIELIANKLKGYSNSSVCIISKAAALNAMRKNRADITLEDYTKAIETTSEEKPDRNTYMAEFNKSRRIGF